MQFIYSDGGRSKYFKGGNVGDCVVRAICNATDLDYKKVYDDLNKMAKTENTKHHRGGKISNARNGVFKETWKKYLNKIGWVRVQTIKRDNPQRMHLTEEECPKEEKCILELPKHLTCLKNGVIYDTYNCSIKQYYNEFGELVTNDHRMIYGYWVRG